MTTLGIHEREERNSNADLLANVVHFMVLLPFFLFLSPIPPSGLFLHSLLLLFFLLFLLLLYSVVAVIVVLLVVVVLFTQKLDCQSKR